jgi:membrane-associated protease RseP (regulator of RpoE activity)
MENEKINNHYNYIKILKPSLHIVLFLLTLFSTAVAGVFWLFKDPFDLRNLYLGLPYAASILFILACHEFGHYFASRYHRVDATLPYFIPFPPTPDLFNLFLNFGTFGAVIKTKSVVPSKKAMFDIGAAGPIAGFIASLIVLIYGFTHLPAKDFILAIHPDYNFIINSSMSAKGLPLSFGDTFLFTILQNIFTDPKIQFVPPMSEIYHYPFLCAGWFGLFVTALNLIPMGQFDGGHIIYAMFGGFHKKIARVSFILLLVISGPAISDVLLRMLYEVFFKSDPGQIIPFAQYSWIGWFVWALISLYVVKLHHPPVENEEPLDTKRTVIGWVCVLIFVVSFSINPFMVG